MTYPTLPNPHPSRFRPRCLQLHHLARSPGLNPKDHQIRFDHFSQLAHHLFIIFPPCCAQRLANHGVDSMLAGSLESLWKSRIPQVEHGWSDAERWLEDGYRRCKKSWKLIQNHPHSSKYTKMNTESLIFKCVRPCWTERNDDHNQVK